MGKKVEILGAGKKQILKTLNSGRVWRSPNDWNDTKLGRKGAWLYIRYKDKKDGIVCTSGKMKMFKMGPLHENKQHDVKWWWRRADGSGSSESSGSSGSQFVFLRCTKSGQVLCWEDRVLIHKDTRGDSAMWKHIEGKSLSSVVGKAVLQVEFCEAPYGCWLAPDEKERCVRVTGPDGAPQPSVYTLVLGPQKLPSVLLEELRNKGLVVVQDVLPPGSVKVLKRKLYSESGNVFLKTPAVARCLAHPVLQWLMTEFLAVNNPHLGHLPTVSLRPKDGSAKWHTDLPYHGKVPFSGPPQGLQCNICVDEFRADNAATQFQPKSHASGSGVPKEWNKGHTRMGRGVHEHVKQMLAPAGSAVIYDARMWHRSCPELIKPGENRVAVLMAVTNPKHEPRWATSDGGSAFESSGTATSLTRREREVVKSMCD